MISQLVLNGLASGALIALLGVGFHLHYSSSKFFAFTYGSAYAYGAYCLLFFRPVIGLAASGVVGVIVAGLLGVMLQQSVFRILRKRRESPLVLMLASIALYTILQNVLSLLFGDSTQSVRPWITAESHLLFNSARITQQQTTIVLSSLVTILLTSYIIYKTSLGRQIRAINDDPGFAAVVGLRVERLSLMSVALSSSIAGLAGMLAAADTGLAPTMGFGAFMLAVVAQIAGSKGAIKGITITGLLFGLFQQMAVWKLNAQWQDLVTFLALAFFLLLSLQKKFRTT